MEINSVVDPTIPLVDLHRHIEGSIRIATIVDLVNKYNIPFPARDFDGIKPLVQVTKIQPGVMAFIAKIEMATSVLINFGACRRVAYECVEDAFIDGIDYLEVRFSPLFMSHPHSLAPEGIVEAVVDGIQAAQEDFGIRTNIIGIISRTYGPDLARLELDALLTQKSFIQAVDLAGDEQNFPGELFVEHFNRVVTAGLQVTIHAGESAGSRSIWQAINQLHAQRIGHAVRAVEDPVLIDYLLIHQIAIESNITSNIQTGTVKNYSEHPLNTFLQKGLLATINSDDPGISGITLRHEYEYGAKLSGLTPQMVKQVQMNGLNAAFLPESEKKAIQAKITSLF
jgi:adenosine deaminase